MKVHKCERKKSKDKCARQKIADKCALTCGKTCMLG